MRLFLVVSLTFLIAGDVTAQVGCTPPTLTLGHKRFQSEVNPLSIFHPLVLSPGVERCALER
jgi:hypothetical protein